MNKIYLLIVAVAIAFSGCGSSSKENNSKLSGAGATFPAPFYNIVFKDYTKVYGNNITYGAIGSGGGIRSLSDKTVDFGASDVFLSQDELSQMGADVIHIPTALGAVVLSYNLPDVKGLKLNSEIISDIYLGKIKNWDDAKIKAVNPDFNLPDKAITPVYRSDGSGTTFVFSDYMSKTNEAWKEALGTGKALNFSVGVAAKGNPGVAGVIAETQGSIGYIGSEYALALNLTSALLQNSSGNYVGANDKSISASANIDLPADTRIMITDSSAPDAYPISTFTWIIAYKEQGYNNRSENTAKALVKLLDYIISDKGQQVAIKTHYASLPPAAVERAKALIESMTYNGQKIIIEQDNNNTATN